MKTLTHLQRLLELFVARNQTRSLNEPQYYIQLAVIDF
jgi:hypothetical protein